MALRRQVHRVLACGSRDWTDAEIIREELARFDREVTVIHGSCRGADALIAIAARELGLTCMPCPADWATLGHVAGVRRTRELLALWQPELVLAFHHDLRSSLGTRDVIRLAQTSGIRVRLVSGWVTDATPHSPRSQEPAPGGG